MTNLTRGTLGVLFRNNHKEVLVVIEDETNDRYGKEKGMLSVPMGSIEEGETPEMTILREFQEETGLKAKISYSLGVFSFEHFGVTVEGLSYIMKPVNGFEKVAKGELESKWIKVEELLSHHFVRPPTREVLLAAVRFLRQKERAPC